MSRIKNPDILRAKVQKIEAKIREVIDNNGRWSDTPNLKDKVLSLLADRACYLDRMFLATPEEVARLEALNEMLLKKVEDMKARAAMLWQTVLTMKQMPEFDDEYYVSAELRVYGDRSDEEAVLHLPEDEYYGSDFALANEAIVAVMPRHWNHSHCGVSVEPWKVRTAGNDPDKAFTSSMEDGKSWAEGALCHPALSHICICYPIHDIVTHLQFSIPDLLRINTFTTKHLHNESDPRNLKRHNPIWHPLLRNGISLMANRSRHRPRLHQLAKEIALKMQIMQKLQLT